MCVGSACLCSTICYTNTKDPQTDLPGVSSCSNTRKRKKRKLPSMMLPGLHQLDARAITARDLIISVSV